jgi:hypothetical protein
MTLLEAIHQMEQIQEALERTYTGAFRKQLPYSTGTYMPPRFAWELRIASGTKKLEEAILRLKSTLAEADPSELSLSESEGSR